MTGSSNLSISCIDDIVVIYFSSIPVFIFTAIPFFNSVVSELVQHEMPCANKLFDSSIIKHGIPGRSVPVTERIKPCITFLPLRTNGIAPSTILISGILHVPFLENS